MWRGFSTVFALISFLSFGAVRPAAAQFAVIDVAAIQQLLAEVQTLSQQLTTAENQLAQVMSGSSGSYPALATSVSSLASSNAVLTPAQIAAFSPAQQAQLAAARQSPALLGALAQAALSNSSSRFTALQTLITALGGATDQKAVLDLNTRVVAEQGMLQNEATKLQVLYQMTQSLEWTRVQRAREQAIASQGSLRTLRAMGL
jgi:type IV secretion system protein VirB5